MGALLLAGCTRDLTDQRISEAETATAEKILNESSNALQGSIIVRFAPSAESRLSRCATRTGATRTGVEGVDAILDNIEGYAVEPVFNITDKNRNKVYERGLHLWYTLYFSEECDIDTVAAELAKVAEVDRLQFSQRVCHTHNPEVVTATQIQHNASTMSTRAGGSIAFNDSYRKYQWALNNLGSNSEVRDAEVAEGLPPVMAGADINVIPAWRLCKGDPSIIVAVLDEGVMWSHEDLAANMWTNSNEIDGDGIDNDHNGYEDDIHGFNFVRLDNNIKWDNKNDSGHGTHVAGIISAVNNNEIGVCGIAGGSGNNDGAKIMSIQIFYGNGGTRTEYVAKGMQYAADNGAHILQNSWGYKSNLVDSSAPSNDRGYKSRLRLEAEAIDYFVANGGDDEGPLKGGLVIFAAGNDGVALPGYPAAYEPCVSVAAFSPSLRPTYFTCYGTGTDIVAPGGEGLYTNGAILSTVPDEFDDPSIEHYGLMQGTSQACPHVSGIAALGLAYAKKLGKRYTANEFRSMLLSATNDIEPYLTGSIVIKNGSNKTINYLNYKGKMGAGYIDAYKLLLQIDGTPYTAVRTGANKKIDLAPYFGDGVHNAQLHQVEISDEDQLAIGFGDCTFEEGKLIVSCSKSGVATLTVTLLVGGGSLNNSAEPYPTKVTKSFVLMTKSGVASNNGWL